MHHTVCPSLLPLNGVHWPLKGGHEAFGRCIICKSPVVLVVLLLLLGLALVVAWLLVPFILCTNCVTGHHEGNPGVGGRG